MSVLSIFEATVQWVDFFSEACCFDLILSPSLSMKIQIMGRENYRKSGFRILPSESQNFFVCPFSLHFQIHDKKCISLFLPIFEYLVLKIRY